MRLRALSGATALTLSIGLAAGATSDFGDEAQAQVEVDYCDTAKIEDSPEVVGGNQVFISVHGLGSKPATWGIRGDEDNYEGTIRQLVDTFPSTHYYAFDYSEYAGRWVTNHNIGPKLADTIECFMQLSREGGGTGKVIILAHSMGGLAAQVALDKIESPENVDVVSFGTPYEGSYYANAFDSLFDGVCTGRYVLGTFFEEMAPDNFNCLGENNALNGLSIDSGEISALPDFPPETSVKAIAGNVTHKFLLTGGLTKAELNSDIVVPVYSATAYYTDNGDGDGVSEISCEGFFVNLPNLTDAPCSHVRMLKDPNVQEVTKDSIEAFIEANQPEPNEGVTLDVLGKLSVPMDGISYEELDAEMPSLEYKIADTTECLGGGDTCPYVSFIDTEGPSGADVYQYMSMHGCMMDTGSGSAPPESIRQIGGKDVIFTESYNGYHNYTSYCWLGIEHGLSVLARAEGAVPFDPTRWQKAFDDEECEWL